MQLAIATQQPIQFKSTGQIALLNHMFFAWEKEHFSRMHDAIGPLDTSGVQHYS